MPQLNGVKTVSDTVIEYDGYRYEKTTAEMQEGDILRHDAYGYDFLPAGAFYLAFFERGSVRVSAEDDAHLDVQGDDDFSVFRRVGTATTADALAAKRAELDRLQAEIAELEAELRPKEGDYARVVGGSYHGTLADGAVVFVDVTDGSEVPYRVKPLLGGEGDWCVKAERLSPAEARAALIAQIDAIFDGKEAVTSE